MAKKPNPQSESVIPYDMASLMDEFKNGKPIGETARIPVVSENFSWKRGFINCWTGWPNDGKSTFFLFMMIMKALCDDWKWGIWSPEMYNVIKGPNGKMSISASDLIDEIVFMLTGLSPYKHYERLYNQGQMKSDRYIAAVEWVQNHFIFVNPKKRSFGDLVDSFRYVYEEHGTDGFLVDPFKNIKHENDGGRFDLYLEDLFAVAKEFSLDTNSSFNFIAHPRNDDPKNPDGSFKVCTQYMLSGGSAWNNSMDGIFSVYRPFKHKNTTDPRVVFFNLKQRKQQLVGRVGMYDKIEFDWASNRYYFDGYCPIDGTFKEPLAIREKKEIEARKAEAAEGADKSKKKVKKEEVKPTPPLIDFTETTIQIDQPKNEHETLF